MAISAETIDQVTLEHLIEAGAVRGADVIGHAGGWSVVVKYGMTERTLAARRGAVRTFRKFETLTVYLKRLGLANYHVNAADFDPATLKTTHARPDAAARMRGAFEAKAHADWVRAKVAKSLADPRPNVPHKQVMNEAQAIIDAKRAQHAAKA